MGKWADGKVLSNKSWGLLKENRYFLWFPLIGFAIALVPLVIFGGTAAFLARDETTVAAIVLAAIGLILMNFAFSISSAAMVVAVDAELEGRDASLGYGFGRAFSRLGALFAWSLIQAAVSVLLGLLRGNNKGGAAVAGSFLAAIGAAAWSIVTLFVTPFIMLKGQGAIAALKSSVLMVKEKWGTQVTGGVRIGLRLLVMILPAIALIVGGFLLILSASQFVIVGVILLGLGILLAIAWALISAAIRSIFAVALFHFTTGEGSIGPFSRQELESVLTTK